MKTLLIWLAFASFATAQQPDASRIQLGPQFVPRFAHLHPDESLIVPEGETVTIHESATYHTIEVAGTLTFCRYCDITLSVVNIQVMPTGTLDMGTPDDSVTGNLDIVIRDMPIDHEADPYEWGNGIFNLGRWYACGAPSPWTHGPLPESAEDADAFRDSIEYESSRNVTIRSENPEGVRGHTVTTMGGYQSFQNTAFLNLGRTLAVDLNNTSQLSDGSFSIGTNNVARYAIHWHHAHPSFDGMTDHGVLQNCYVDGGGVNKWGVVIHGTHFVKVEGNVVKGYVGAGIVTEDGNETRNTISNNLIMDISGNGRNDKDNQSSGRNNPGAGGSGIWLHGARNTVTGNVVLGSAVGIQFFNRELTPSVLAKKAPAVVGGEHTEVIAYQSAGPIDCSGNVTIDCKVGIETWNTPGSLVISDATILRSASTGMFVGNGEPGSVTLRDSVIDGAIIGVSSSQAYTSSVVLDGVSVSNCSRFGVGDANRFLLSDSTLSNNGYDIRVEAVPSDSFTVRNSMLNSERKFLNTVDAYKAFRSPRSVPRMSIVNWQGTGQDYYLLFPHQDRSNPMPLAVSHDVGLVFGSPLAGLNAGETYDRWGLAPHGFAGDYASATVIEGAIRGVPISSVDAPPRFVLTHPNASQPLPANTDRINFRVAYTGAMTGHVLGKLTYDGGEIPLRQSSIDASTGYFGIKRQFQPGAFTPGTHRVTTQAGDGEVLEFAYHIGAPSPPPEPPVDPEPEPTECEKAIAELEARVASLEVELADKSSVIEALEAKIAAAREALE